MSIGVNMLKKLVTLASKNLSENADIEISEIHHNSKIDTPSGTSITLAESVKEGAPNVKKTSSEISQIILKGKKSNWSVINQGWRYCRRAYSFFFHGWREN